VVQQKANPSNHRVGACLQAPLPDCWKKSVFQDHRSFNAIGSDPLAAVGWRTDFRGPHPNRPLFGGHDPSGQPGRPEAGFASITGQPRLPSINIGYHLDGIESDKMYE
jgi:hypothetical protein